VYAVEAGCSSSASTRPLGELELTPMILREVDVFTTVAHVCDSDLPAALDLLATTDVAAVAAGPTIPLDALVDAGLRPLAERRASGKILVTPRG
jgi:(R,R)-butanediol dehydrogenase / meso-butanediol dehydrogenase / diacetyl reductase